MNLDNKKKTISDYEKRLMEDRAMLDELVEENYMSGSEMIKNQLKHFRQELDYMENQLYFIKYEMREQKVTEVTVKNNIEEEVVQKESIQVKNEDIVQTADEVKDKVIGSQSVKSNSEEATVKQAVIAKTSEATVKDYNLYLDDITITKGRIPKNDYEVIVNKSNLIIFYINN